MDCARTVDVLALSNRLNRPLCSPRQQLARHVARARVPGRPGDGFDALGRGAGARGRSERDRSCRRRSRACVSGVPSLQPLLCVRVTDVTSTIWGSCFRYFAARDAWRQRSWPVMCHDDAGGPLRRGGLEPLQSLQRWLGTVTAVTAMAWNCYNWYSDGLEPLQPLQRWPGTEASKTRRTRALFDHTADYRLRLRAPQIVTSVTSVTSTFPPPSRAANRRRDVASVTPILVEHVTDDRAYTCCYAL